VAQPLLLMVFHLEQLEQERLIKVLMEALHKLVEIHTEAAVVAVLAQLVAMALVLEAVLVEQE
jgi:hypothetical protein